MENISAFELRRRAAAAPMNDLAQWVQHEMFKLLLYRAIHEEDSGLDILIRTPDPKGWTANRDKDRIYIVDRKNALRTGTGIRHLTRNYALTCYLVACEVLPLHHGGGSQAQFVSEGEIVSLANQARQLVGTLKLPPMFEMEIATTPALTISTPKKKAITYGDCVSA